MYLLPCFVFIVAGLALAKSNPEISTDSLYHQTAHNVVRGEPNSVSAAWYAGWHADNFTLDDVSWDKYTQLTYAFG